MSGISSVSAVPVHRYFSPDDRNSTAYELALGFFSSLLLQDSPLCTTFSSSTDPDIRAAWQVASEATTREAEVAQRILEERCLTYMNAEPFLRGYLFIYISTWETEGGRG